MKQTGGRLYEIKFIQFQPDNKKTIIKNLFNQSIVPPYLKYLASQKKKNNEIQGLLNQINQIYLINNLNSFIRQKRKTFYDKSNL
ncbi:unnamed protein product [Paramecium sonneborni]|uniref:Uncharacterized protein n=1 Tax=Paramecium sonneborni TaxID=65129 RepID=A0A8S1RRD0_9CILI|nr:unnamed protein product [Paramecium sonneborni]